MRFVVAAIALLASFGANAICYRHPDTGVLYCHQASECPANSVWNYSNQACEQSRQPEVRAAGQDCTGTDAGTYVPQIISIQNALDSGAFQSTWTRVKNVMTVSGAFWVLPQQDGQVTRATLAQPAPSPQPDNFTVVGVATADGPTVSVRGSLSGSAEFESRGMTPGTSWVVRYVYSYPINNCS